MFVIFLVYRRLTSPRKSVNSKETFVLNFVFFFGFLAFGPRWILWCLSRNKVSPQDCLLIPKVNHRTVYPKKLIPWPPVCLLSSEKVVFLSLLSEWVDDWSSSAWTIRLDKNSLSECSLLWLISQRTKFGSNKVVFVINLHRAAVRI